MQIEDGGRTTIRPFFSGEPHRVSDELLHRLSTGDEDAAHEVFQQYLERLTALARSRLSARLSPRIDPDDIVMSAYRSFFLRARRGEFHLAEGRDLWHLLVEITLHKLYRQTAHHTAQRRSYRRETAASEAATAAQSREPSPETAAAVADELAAVIQELSPDVRRVLELRLQGCQIDEIAQSEGKSDRTVRRWLEDAKAALRKRFPQAVPLDQQRPPKITPRSKPLWIDSLLPDSLLEFHDYKLTRQIGAGGSGKVYRAVVRPAGTVVAVKFLKRSLLRRRELIERFVNEAKLVATLRHPGIIRIHGVGRTPNRGFFLAMDYWERGDLQTLLRAGQVSLRDALRWVGEGAEAIQHAHNHGVIHCDLKPGNLLLADDGRIVVSDFGLARTSDDLLRDDIAGTPAFLAPEQLDPRWGAIGPRTDVYGLGAILYALLAGHPPRTGSVRDILNAIAAGRAPNPISGVPSNVAAFIQACLWSHSDARPVSAGQVAAQLQAVGKIISPQLDRISIINNNDFD
jgi:RNA polymerase sigma factor (sigma-70 family)